MLLNIFANFFLVLGVLGALIVFSYMNYHRTKNGWTLGHTWDTPRALFPLCLSWASYCIGLTIKTAASSDVEQQWQLFLWGAITLLFLLQAAGCLALGLRQWDFSLDGQPGLDPFLKPRQSWRGLLVLLFLLGHLGIAGWQSSSYLNTVVIEQPLERFFAKDQQEPLSTKPSQTMQIERPTAVAASDSSPLALSEVEGGDKEEPDRQSVQMELEEDKAAPLAELVKPVALKPIEAAPDPSQLNISNAGQLSVVQIVSSSTLQTSHPRSSSKNLPIPTFTSTAMPQPRTQPATPQPTASQTALPIATPTQAPPTQALPTQVPSAALPPTLLPTATSEQATVFVPAKITAPTEAPILAIAESSSRQIIAPPSEQLTLLPTPTSTLPASALSEKLVQSNLLILSTPESVHQYDPIPSWQLWPPTEFSINDRVDFKWQVGFPLHENQAFEVIFWKAGEIPFEDGLGLAPPVKDEQIHVYLFELDERFGQMLEPGQYQWGILLVETEPSYKRLAYLGAGHTFRYHPAERPY